MRTKLRCGATSFYFVVVEVACIDNLLRPIKIESSSEAYVVLALTHSIKCINKEFFWVSILEYSWLFIQCIEH